MTARRPITTVRTVVSDIAPAGRDVKRFVLTEPTGWELPPFAPGAHIDLHLPDGTVRTYSLCNDPAEQHRYVVAVKREPAGRGGSVLLHDEVRVGDEIGVSLPRGGLDLGDGGTSHVFVGAGIGITPFLSAAAALRRVGRADFVLHVVSRGEPPMADHVAPLVDAGLAVLHDTRAGERPDVAALVGPPRAGVAVACCGPAGLIDDFEKATAGWAPEQVRIEYFVPPVLPPEPDARPYTLVLARSGTKIDAPAGAAVLDVLRANGVDVPSSCEGGICGACHVPWLAGDPVHRDRALTPAERRHTLLACVASANESLTLDL